MKASPCQTMACLDAQELVDFENPKESAILSQIQMAEPTSELITEKVIQEEYDGFLEWIEYSAKCHDYVCGSFTKPCCDPESNIQTPGTIGPLGGCTEENLTDSFQSLIFRWHSRCHGCHSKCDPEYDAPCWLVEFFDKDDPTETRKAAQNTMYNLIGMGSIDRENPKKSLLLLKPLAEEDGGLEHGGGEKFLGHWDSSYQDFVLWLEMYSSCHKGAEYQRPVVRITSPQTKNKIYRGDEIVLLARAEDLQDGTIEGEDIQWTSTGFGRQTFTGTGPFVTTMTAGKHVIKVTAKDSDGNIGYRELRVRIRVPKERPTEEALDVVTSSDIPPPPPTLECISNDYSFDKDIASNPLVIWAQSFDMNEGEESLANFDFIEGQAGIDIKESKLLEKSQNRALELRAGLDKPSEVSLVKQFPELDKVFLRFYLKRPKQPGNMKGSVSLGGLNPPTLPPIFSDAQPPLGNDLFQFGIKPLPLEDVNLMGIFGRWMHMHHAPPSPGEPYSYPDNQLNHNTKASFSPKAWQCVEISIRLNDSTSSMEGASLRVWLNNELISGFNADSEVGYWLGSHFCEANSELAPCNETAVVNEEELQALNLQIRNNLDLKLNHFSPKVQGDSEQQAIMLLDQIVLAHKRIGCMVP